MSTDTIIEITREHNPFPRDGIWTGEDGIPRYQDLPDSLLALLESQVDARPDAEAVVELGGPRLTYRQLWDRAARVAGGLRAAGVQRGDRVAVRYPAGVNWVLAFWGSLMAGGIAVPVNTGSSAPEMEFVLTDAGVTVDLGPGTALPDGEVYVEAGLGHADVAAMFYTSGTTGRHPKGVPTTHEAFLTNNQNMVRCVGLPADIGPELRTLISVPLFHVTGCNSQLLTATQVGGASVIMPALNLPALISSLATERITFMVTVPAVYALLLRRPELAATDVSGVRWVGYGGAPIAPALVQSLQEAFPGGRVTNGYGMTETASIITVLPHDDAVEHADSVGYAVPSVDLAIVPQGADPTLGELVARGANVTSSYWQRPETTAETIIDGWLHTGDIVRVDGAGRVHIVDRTKDIIIRGGENISSIEVEAALLSAPGVLEAAVLAVQDDVMGEKVGAVVYGGEATLDIDTILAHCRERLAHHKVPQYVSITGMALPRNAGGKVLKVRLRESVEWGTPLR